MLYLPKPKMSITEQFKMKPKSYEFKEFARKQLAKRKHKYFAADFECTVEEPYYVYMVTIEDIETHEQYFYKNIDEFLMFCEDHPNSTFYFHNGEKYDFEFIRNKVLRDDNDWYHTNKSGSFTITKKLDELEVTEKGTKIKMKKGLPQLLNATIRFRDTLDIVSGSISSIGNQIGLEKGFGNIDTPLVAYINDDNWIEKTKDFVSELIEHHGDYKVDFLKNGWWHYAMQDTKILAEIIRYYKITEHADNNEYTAAKISYNEMVNGYEPYYNQVKQLRKEVNDSKKERRNIDDPRDRAVTFASKMKQYNLFAKEAYKGGLAWAHNVLSNELIENIVGYHLDYNSMYPSIYMLSDLYPLPGNIPTDEPTNLFIIKLKNLTGTCKRDKFPLIKCRTQTVDGKLSSDVNARYYLYKLAHVDTSLTSVEYRYLMENYEDVNYDSCEVYFYKRDTILEAALRKHGEKWYKLKEQHSKEKNNGAKAYDKMMLNSVYGYLGFFSKLVKTYDYVLGDDNVTHKVLRTDEGGNSMLAELGMDYAEVPAAAFITAYGRVKLAEDINKIGVENVVCTDTDSLFVINKSFEELNELVEIDEYKLGALACEHVFSKIRAIKPKTWCISYDYNVHCNINDLNWNVDYNFYTIKHLKQQQISMNKKYGYKPIGQATAGSNYKFNDIRNFKPGEVIMSSRTFKGVGGVGILKARKVLGSFDNGEDIDYVTKEELKDLKPVT